jgi:hypothetical protein
MASTVFVSHAGADADRAGTIAGLLQAAGVQIRYDREELCLGDSFLAFMNNALTISDYCLLLWSKHASATPWVQLEWESALYRSVQEKQSFLVVGRLEDMAVPALLGPRLRVDLFPELQSGVTSLLNTWRDDRGAEKQTGKPIAAARTFNPAPELPDSVYLTSEQFSIAMPVRVDLSEPVAITIERLIGELNLPKQLSHESGIGVRFSYQLALEEEVLARTKSLAVQGVGAGAILWLQTTMSTFSSTTPVAGGHSSVTFRTAGIANADEDAARESAEAELLRVMGGAGLI